MDFPICTVPSQFSHPTFPSKSTISKGH